MNELYLYVIDLIKESLNVMGAEFKVDYAGNFSVDDGKWDIILSKEIPYTVFVFFSRSMDSSTARSLMRRFKTQANLLTLAVYPGGFAVPNNTNCVDCWRTVLFQA